MLSSFKEGVASKVEKLITGQRMTAERADLVAKILTKEGLKKPDIERLLALNKKVFTPSKGTEGTVRGVTMQASPALQNMYSDKKSINDYMR